MSLSREFLEILPEVEAALNENKPVVALESTIISHGMPYPQNLQTARQLSKIIEEKGAVPATIAVISGRIKVGLSPEDLEELAFGENVLKLSRLDLPYAVSQKRTGATTVAATMIVAEAAGISFFATGGVGGVHRGAEQTFDISADLVEFSKTNVAVISAGVKAILDIPKTIEILETLGVPVIGYGTMDFPAFFSRSSGQQVNFRMDEISDIARFIHTKWQMDLKGGVLIANPVPGSNNIDPGEIELVIESAVREAYEKGIHGKDLTPFLLSAVNDKTRGRSLQANIALVENNARVAAALAVSYTTLSH